MSNLRILVIGGNGAGLSAASQAARINHNTEIIVFEASPFISFGACGLPYYLSGEVGDFKTLFHITSEQMKDRGITVKTNTAVKEIDTAASRIDAVEKETGFSSYHDYDRLIIATGSVYAAGPFTPGKPKGVLGVRSAVDSVILKTFLETKKPEKVVIAGGNLLGLEMAESFSRRGMAVTVVEMKERIMPDFGESLSAIMLKRLEENGVQVIQGTPVSSVSADNEGYLKSVELGNGTVLETDMLFLAIGAKPDSELGLKAGCSEGVYKTIATNRKMMTSLSHVYACGDCAQFTNRINSKGMFWPLGSTANRSGRTAGENAAGGDADFPGIMGTYGTPAFGLEAVRTGLTEEDGRKFAPNLAISESQSLTTAEYLPDSTAVNIRLLYNRDNRKLVGAELIGGPGSGSRINVFAAALSANMTLDEIYGLDLEYNPKLSPVWDPVLFAAGLAKFKEDHRA
ncbi:MAG: FAD-dependent oxidoreductase [Chloroflexi bacterium]|nr:FAD-dependent oxidoreductase [Chloroflexota bacterium]